MKIPIYKAKSIRNGEEVTGFYCCSVCISKDFSVGFEHKSLNNYLISMVNDDICIHHIRPETLQFYCFIEPSIPEEIIKSGIIFTMFKGEEHEKEFEQSLYR